mgnify:CR=1 FL=1
MAPKVPHELVGEERQRHRALHAAVGEDAPDIGRHEEPVHEPASPDGVLDAILHRRSLPILSKRLEAMLVSPQPVGSPPLLVDETLWRFPHGYLGSPAQRQRADTDAEVDQ